MSVVAAAVLGVGIVTCGPLALSCVSKRRDGGVESVAAETWMRAVAVSLNGKSFNSLNENESKRCRTLESLHRIDRSTPK